MMTDDAQGLAVLYVVTMHDYGAHDVIGVYDSRERADGAIAQWKARRGFRDMEFAVDACWLNNGTVEAA